MGVAIPTVLAGLGSKFAANVIIFQGHPRGSLLLSSENVTITVVKDEGESRKGNEKGGWEAFADQEKKDKGKKERKERKEGKKREEGRKEEKRDRRTGEKKKKKKSVCVFSETQGFSLLI